MNDLSNFVSDFFKIFESLRFEGPDESVGSLSIEEAYRIHPRITGSTRVR